MIQIYTGDGKGKTTAAVGLAIRAVGAGKKVCLIQFLKGQETSEVKILESLDVKVFRFGGKGFVDPKKPLKEDVEEVKKGLEKAEWVCRGEACLARGSVTTDPYEIVILDEINVAVLFKLISEDAVLELIKSVPPETELILTGRGATPRMIELADLVTEMKLIKHPFNKGIKARKGIEF